MASEGGLGVRFLDVSPPKADKASANLPPVPARLSGDSPRAEHAAGQKQVGLILDVR